MDGTRAQTEDEAAAPDENPGALGSEMRQVRKARVLTLKQVATGADISVSHLSAIERGRTNPSLDVVQRIAQALDIDPEWFFAPRHGQGPMERAYVVRQRNRRNLNTLYGEGLEALGLTDQLLSSSIGGNFFMGVATYAPHSTRPGHPMYQHDGEQHGFILSGELQLQIADEKITLHEGDSYSFPTSILHNAQNVTDNPCQLVWSISPAIIPKDVVVGHWAAKGTDKAEWALEKTQTTQ
ncbi:MAG: helix-turn-helix transcriptional regulator [Silicimonas sp.]|nr:helix-turn-helix transcriptional regulator [Silicimonas sp.]